jgi:hypothetical protein
LLLMRPNYLPQRSVEQWPRNMDSLKGSKSEKFDGFNSRYPAVVSTKSNASFMVKLHTYEGAETTVQSYREL